MFRVFGRDVPASLAGLSAGLHQNYRVNFHETWPRIDPTSFWCGSRNFFWLSITFLDNSCQFLGQSKRSKDHLSCIHVYTTVLGNSSVLSQVLYITWYLHRIVFASHAIRNQIWKSTIKQNWNDKLAWCCGKGSCEFGCFIWEAADINISCMQEFPTSTWFDQQALSHESPNTGRYNLTAKHPQWQVKVINCSSTCQLPSW